MVDPMKRSLSPRCPWCSSRGSRPIVVASMAIRRGISVTPSSRHIDANRRASLSRAGPRGPRARVVPAEAASLLTLSPDGIRGVERVCIDEDTVDDVLVGCPEGLHH